MTTEPTPLQERIARAIYEAEMPSPRYQWAALRNEAKDRRRQQAVAVLPLIAAEVRRGKADAWEKGFEAGWGEHADPGPFVNDLWDAKTPNPYSAAPIEQED